MPVKCSVIMDFMEKYAPASLAEEWDNVGLMVGDFDMPVKNILAALDINDSVIDEAVWKKADMIITHHPFIFGSIKNVNSASAVGRRILKVIKNDIAVFSAHTNLDIAKNGTNDTLADILELKNISFLNESFDGINALGRVGELDSPSKFIDFAEYVKKTLNMDNLTITGDRNKIIKKVGLCTGQGSDGDYMKRACALGCDAYITGDLRYHEAQFANNMDLCVIDITHYESEALIIPVLCNYLNKCAEKNDLDFKCFESKVNGQTLSII